MPAQGKSLLLPELNKPLDIVLAAVLRINELDAETVEGYSLLCSNLLDLLNVAEEDGLRDASLRADGCCADGAGLGSLRRTMRLFAAFAFWVSM